MIDAWDSRVGRECKPSSWDFHFVLLTLEVELKVAQTSEDHAMTIDKANDSTRGDMWRGYQRG